MRNYCALGDTRYLPHLICLIDSVRANFADEYKLHILALDENTQQKLESLRPGSDIVIYPISQVNEDFQIRSVRYMQPSREAISNAQASNKDPGFVQFCWALAPCFSSWLMDRIKTSVTYIDADIYFFIVTPEFFKQSKSLQGQGHGLFDLIRFFRMLLVPVAYYVVESYGDDRLFSRCQDL